MTNLYRLLDVIRTLSLGRSPGARAGGRRLTSEKCCCGGGITRGEVNLIGSPAVSVHPLASPAIAVVLGACVGTTVPDPQEAARAYAEAAARADDAALYDLLSEDAKQVLTPAEVKQLVADQKAELAERGKALGAPGVRVKTEARVKYGDGEEAALTIEENEFRVSAADALPAEARTPAQALDQLRRVLARRSYAGLIRVLSPRTRAAVEEDLKSLVEGLEEPEGLDVQVTGDTAVVNVPGGHFVRLRREGGVWHVEDFD